MRCWRCRWGSEWGVFSTHVICRVVLDAGWAGGVVLELVCAGGEGVVRVCGSERVGDPHKNV